MAELRLNPVYYAPEHLAFRQSVRRFTAAEIAPQASAWDEAGAFPRELYAKAAAIGLLGAGFPEEYGGIAGTDTFHRLVACVELAQCGAGGIIASLMSHTIAMPPVAALGSAELKARVGPGASEEAGRQARAAAKRGADRMVGGISADLKILHLAPAQPVLRELSEPAA